jgi:hypothetical protein
MEKIQEFLEDYQDLWWEIADCDPEYPVMDVCLEKIDDEDYYGVDFTGDKSVYQIFFSGSSNYFAAVWPSNDNNHNDDNLDNLDNLDKYPIYIFDMEDTSSPELKCVGNFKKFINLVIDDFLELNIMDDKTNALVNELLDDLDEFSDELINNDNYVVKYAD